MEAYVSFVPFVAHDFQEFLAPFQSTEPILQIDERATEEEIRHEDKTVIR